MRTVAVVSVGRSDYGALLPVLRQIRAEPALRLHLIVSGAHLSEEHGRTARAIEADGIPIDSRVEVLEVSDTPEAIATSMGKAVIGFARVLANVRPDWVLILGDRFEMHAAALAALPFTIPVAHIHGGELTQGAIDDGLRHSMTKLSHLHFVATQESARRVVQLGEAPWRVVVSGAPTLDQVRATSLLAPRELEGALGIRCEPAPLLVTFHPVTLEYAQAEWQTTELLAALETTDRPVVLTRPNADTNHRIVTRLLETFAKTHASARFVESLGTARYFSLMACAAAMVGNSSSGIIEAPSFGLPVVNIGTRQQGRLRADNVIDVGYRREEIIQGLRRALTPECRARLRGRANPYGDGHAAETIVRTLRDTPLDARLMQKRFHDLTSPAVEWSEQVAAHVS